MAAGATYEPIATQTLGSAVASITFSSIPSTYTDLIIIGNYVCISNRLSMIRVNGDTGSNYSVTYMGGNGSSGFSGQTSNDTVIYGPNNNNVAATGIIQINNYSNTSTYKTILTNGGAAQSPGNVGASVGTWRSTAAINSVTWFPNGDDWAVGSTFTIYGIKAA